jgi:hypothetical protein
VLDRADERPPHTAAAVIGIHDETEDLAARFGFECVALRGVDPADDLLGRFHDQHQIIGSRQDACEPHGHRGNGDGIAEGAAQLGQPGSVTRVGRTDPHLPVLGTR